MLVLHHRDALHLDACAADRSVGERSSEVGTLMSGHEMEMEMEMGGLSLSLIQPSKANPPERSDAPFSRSLRAA